MTILQGGVINDPVTLVEKNRNDDDDDMALVWMKISMMFNIIEKLVTVVSCYLFPIMWLLPFPKHEYFTSFLPYPSPFHIQGAQGVFDFWLTMTSEKESNISV